MTVAEFGDCYEMGISEVMRMPMAQFFAFLEVMPEVRRRKDMRQHIALVRAGQRGLADEDYDAAMDELTEVAVRRKVRRGNPEEVKQLRELADALNSQFG